MRKNRQIILTLMITAALAGLAWLAGSQRPALALQQVVALRQDLAAGSRLDEAALLLVDVPASLDTSGYIAHIGEAAGLWTTVDLAAGELLMKHRLTTDAAGLFYPHAAPGRRLMTIRLDRADANGFWLASGSLVDIYLVPRTRQSADTFTVLERIRIIRLLDHEGEAGLMASPSRSDPLICLDLSVDQADLLAGCGDDYSIRLTAINEP